VATCTSTWGAPWMRCRRTVKHMHTGECPALRQLLLTTNPIQAPADSRAHANGVTHACWKHLRGPLCGDMMASCPHQIPQHHG
jgi:hypothetical protein